MDADEYEATLSHTPHLRPFLTSKLYLGVGSESLTERDSVWIIRGSRVPLILRQQGGNENQFELVGGAYVHGFMDGEALKLGNSFKQITLT